MGLAVFGETVAARTYVFMGQLKPEFAALSKKFDCIGGTMMKIADYLTEIGMSGADCAGTMMDEYTELLERVGIEQKKAAKNVIGLFMPLIHKYRHGMKIK